MSLFFQKAKRMYYAVLGHRALELHESEKKSHRKNRHPRHLVDLSTCFNINRHVSRISIFKCEFRLIVTSHILGGMLFNSFCRNVSVLVNGKYLFLHKGKKP